MIKFKFDALKFASATAYIAEHKTPVTKKEICKLLFFADQWHLLQYGRTITGDRYHALKQGPVPTHGLDMLNENHRSSIADIEIMRQFGRLHGKTFVPSKKAERAVFSRSDLRVLNQVLEELGSLSADELENLSHQETAWSSTPQPKVMDFDLFFEGHSEADAMRQLVKAEHSR